MNSPSGLDFLPAVFGTHLASHLPIPAKSRSSSTTSASSSSSASGGAGAVFSSNSNLPDETLTNIMVATHQEAQAMMNHHVHHNVHNVIDYHPMIIPPKEHRTNRATNNNKTFPEILMEILSDPAYASIISWLPSGKSFAIHNPALFSSLVLPQYFKSGTTAFRSFVRRLNRWGFISARRRESKSAGKCKYECATFEHGYFLRDYPELCGKMHHCRPATTLPTIKASAVAARDYVIERNAGFMSSYGAPSPFTMNDNYRTEQMMPPDKKMYCYPESSSSELSSLRNVLVNDNTALARGYYDAPSHALSACSFQVPQVSVRAASSASPYVTSGMLRHHNEEFEFPTTTDMTLQQRENNLETELLLLREMRRRRQRALARHLHQHQMSAVEATVEAEVDANVAQLLAARWTLLLGALERGGHDHGRPVGI